MFFEPEVRLKPWGKEIWWANMPEYAGKTLFIKKGKRLSLQYHEKKKETQYILSGKIKFIYGTDDHDHRFNAVCSFGIDETTFSRV